MRISDWSSDVCSSDLIGRPPAAREEGDAAARFAQRIEQAVGGFDRPEAVEDRAHAHTAFRREQQSVEDAPARDIALENIHDQIDAVRRAVDEVEDAYQPGAAVAAQFEPGARDLPRQALGPVAGRAGGG